MESPTLQMHALIDRRMDFANKAAAARAQVAIAEMLLLSAQEDLRWWNDTQTAAIASEVNADTGKPLYSNAEKRSAVLFQLQDADPAFAALDTARRDAARHLIQVQQEHDNLKAAAMNLNDRVIWAQNLATNPASAPMLMELIEATTPPPEHWPNLDSRDNQADPPPDPPMTDTLVPAVATVPDPNNS